MQWGSIALNAASAAWTGSGFGILILADSTEFTTLTTDTENPAVLTAVVFNQGTYLPISVSAADLTSGAVLIGKTFKRQ
jgi:hypothetical protein